MLLLLLVRNLMKADWLCLISWGGGIEYPPANGRRRRRREKKKDYGGCGSWLKS